LNAHLESHGMAKAYSVTPTFRYDPKLPHQLNSIANIRVREIMAWLKGNQARVSRWVAVDDMDLAECDGIRGHFVLTLSEEGLLEEHANAIIKLLKG